MGSNANHSIYHGLGQQYPIRCIRFLDGGDGFRRVYLDQNFKYVLWANSISKPLRRYIAPMVIALIESCLYLYHSDCFREMVSTCPAPGMMHNYQWMRDTSNNVHSLWEAPNLQSFLSVPSHTRHTLALEFVRNITSMLDHGFSL